MILNGIAVIILGFIFSLRNHCILDKGIFEKKPKISFKSEKHALTTQYSLASTGVMNKALCRLRPHSAHASRI